jgi:hypothetical protein
VGKRRQWAAARSRAALAVAERAGKGVRLLPGLGAAACFVTAGTLLAVPVGLAVAGVFLLLVDWRLR